MYLTGQSPSSKGNESNRRLNKESCLRFIYMDFKCFKH